MNIPEKKVRVVENPKTAERKIMFRIFVSFPKTTSFMYWYDEINKESPEIKRIKKTVVRIGFIEISMDRGYIHFLLVGFFSQSSTFKNLSNFLRLVFSNIEYFNP